MNFLKKIGEIRINADNPIKITIGEIQLLNLLEKKIENCEDDQLYFTKIFLFDNKIDNMNTNKIKLTAKILIYQY